MKPLLVEATDAEKAERDLLTFAEWGQRLDQRLYLRREQRLRALRWSRSSMRTWLWKDAASGRVLSSCETYFNESRLRGQPGQTLSIASVFTEAALRGRGYAEAMLRALLGREEWASRPGLQAWVLFSEIGEELYRRVGFEAVPSFNRLYEARPLPADRGASAGADAEILSRAEALRDWAEQGRRLAGEAPGGAFRILPGEEQIAWHLEREVTYAELLGERAGATSGARLGRSRLLWATQHKARLLQAIHFSAESDEAARALIAIGQAEAHRRGLGKLLVWESELAGPWPEDPKPLERAHREEAVVMIRPVAAGLRAEDFSPVSRSCWV